MDGENLLRPWREGMKERGIPIAYRRFTTNSPWSGLQTGGFTLPP
jgi:hypothetical protein